SGELLRLAVCLRHRGRAGRCGRHGGGHSGEAHALGRDVCRAGTGREERGAGGRDAHPFESDGLRRPGGAGHQRPLQGASRTVRDARRSWSRPATPQDPARWPAVRGGGAMTPRVEADTPLMQQYREIKARYPDTILFFRMGDFYEMFEDDAQLAARELGLTLTSRNSGGAAEVPLAGVPGAVRIEREAWEFDPELAREELARTFRVASVDGLGVEPGDRPALGAVGALLRYARELKPGGLPQLARPRVLRRGDLLPLDDMTRRNLELVEPLRAAPAGAAGTTLPAVLDRTLP